MYTRLKRKVSLIQPLTMISLVILSWHDKIVAVRAAMARNPKEVRFSVLCRVCDYFFGSPRQSSSSHRVYKTPWQGDPRINIQNHKGMAKAYQVKQVLLALEKLGVQHGTEK